MAPIPIRPIVGWLSIGLAGLTSSEKGVIDTEVVEEECLDSSAGTVRAAWRAGSGKESTRSPDGGASFGHIVMGTKIGGIQVGNQQLQILIIREVS
jgi:hypothetical protein